MKTITDDVQRYLNGEGEFEGRPVLVVNNDFRVTTGQIYSRLHQDDQFGFAIGRGLVKRGLRSAMATVELQGILPSHSSKIAGGGDGWYAGSFSIPNKTFRILGEV